MQLGDSVRKSPSPDQSGSLKFAKQRLEQEGSDGLIPGPAEKTSLPFKFDLTILEELQEVVDFTA